MQKVNSLVLGDPLDAKTTIGPLVNGAAVEKVDRHVQDAVSKGAEIATGGAAAQGQGHYYQPTVLTGVTDAAAISTEETFGPIAPLYSFSSEEEVIARANDVDVGLAGYVYTQDVGRVHRVSEALAVGMVAVNTGVVSQPCIPFGGVKASGFGREGGRSGIDEYMVGKVRNNK